MSMQHGAHVLCGAICSLALLVGFPALADVHYAGGPYPGGEPPYATPETAAWRIQDAMEAAEDGDTVLCLSAVYSGKIVVKHGVRLLGYGPEQCVIVGRRDMLGDIELNADTTVAGFRLVDCILLARDAGPCAVRDCIFDGSLMSCGSARCEITSSRFEGLWGDGLPWWPAYLLASLPGGGLRVTGCTFHGEVGASMAGISVHDGVTLEVSHCTFSGCRAGIEASDAHLIVRRCSFFRNELGVDTGLLGVSVENCTFYRNDWAVTTGPTNYLQAFKNCVIRSSGEENVLPKGKGYPPEMHMPTITFSNVEGGYAGRGNIDADPMFFLPSGDEPDLHLCAFSPCVDAGDPFSDYSNEPEPNGGRINMGAYGGTWEATTSELVDVDGDNLRDDWEIEQFGSLERDGTGDADGDGLSDRDEYRYLANPNNPDTDGDGLLDGQEVFDLSTNPTMADTDNDGTPDGKEAEQGTDPLDPWDAFTIITFWIENDQIHVVHPVQPRYWFHLESSFWPNGPFGSLSSDWAGRWGVLTHTFVANLNPHTRFFRVKARSF